MSVNAQMRRPQTTIITFGRLSIQKSLMNKHCFFNYGHRFIPQIKWASSRENLSSGFTTKCPCENEVGFIGTVLELSGTHFNGTFWDNHLIPINPNIGIIWY